MAFHSTEIRDLEGVLGSKLGEKYEIIGYSTTSLTAVGDNYGSTMLSLTVTVKAKSSGGGQENWDLVAKMSPTVPMLRDIFQIDLTFPKECSIYTTAAPELNRFQRESKVPRQLQLNVFCDCFGARDKDNEPILVLENLKMQGYEIGDRSKGFDQVPLIEYILTNLAQFHAVPIALRYAKPEVFAQKIRPSLDKLCMEKGMQPGVHKEMFEVLNSNIASIPELAHLKEPIRRHLDLGWRRANDLNYQRESAFNSICHNDFWMNNMMIRYAPSGHPECVKFVDFQLTMYGSGIQDLIFFLFTSVHNDILQTDCDRLIQYYLKQFIDCLSAHGCPLEDFNADSIQKEIGECAFDEFHHILLMTKVLLMKKVDGATEVSDDFMVNSDLIGPEYYEKIKLVVLEFEKRNWIAKDIAVQI